MEDEKKTSLLGCFLGLIKGIVSFVLDIMFR